MIPPGVKTPIFGQHSPGCRMSNKYHCILHKIPFPVMFDLGVDAKMQTRVAFSQNVLQSTNPEYSTQLTD